MPYLRPSPTPLPLLPNNARKPLDFGASSPTPLSASLTAHGQFLNLFGNHPKHGQIIVAPWEQFPAEKHYDQSFVRSYRARGMASFENEDGGFGLTLKGEQQSTPAEWTYLGSWPMLSNSIGQCQVESTFFVHESSFIQETTLSNPSSSPITLSATLSGPMSLHRAAYSQLTPRGDCSIPPVENHLECREGRIILQNKHLPSTLSIELYVDDEPVVLELETQTSSDPLNFSLPFDLTLPAGSSKTVHLALTLIPELEIPPLVTLPTRLPTSLINSISPEALAAILGGGERGDELAYVVLRNLSYLLDCLLIPLGDDKGTCVMTDHQCLPLGWNRDNYWQIYFLISLLPHLPSILPPSKAASAHSQIKEIIRSHLVWVFKTALRPDGFWPRSYFTNGIPKDEVFQLDQQCYPLLELCEYASLFWQDDNSAEELEFVAGLAKGVVDDVLAVLLKHKWTPEEGKDDKRDIWLFKTDETPADDEVEYPYLLSSHILLHYTISSLAGLKDLVGKEVISTPVEEWAVKIHRDTLEQFSTTFPRQGQGQGGEGEGEVAVGVEGKQLLAYLTSTYGQFQFYHDANDLPLALAPEWGFLPPSSPLWQNTISFGFSSANTEGYYPGGQFGGLGSVHTRDPWPLGDGQKLAVLAIQKKTGTGQMISKDSSVHANGHGVGQGEEVNETLEKIVKEAQWDGLFGEAVDRYTGKVTSKNWFSWPGSFISSVLLRYGDVLFESSGGL